MKNLLVTATVAVTTCLSVAACGADSEPSAAPAAASSHARGVDASVVRGMTDYDFAQTKNVNAAARKASTVVVGEVLGWADGRTTVESDDPAYEAIAHTAVLSVKVSKSMGPGKASVGDVLQVEVPRGNEVLVDGAAPAGTTPVLRSISELERAVPAGTQVIVLANAARTESQLRADTPGLVVRDKGKVAEGSLLSPTVQGLLFRDTNGDFVSGLADGEGDWGWLPASTPQSHRFSALVAQLEHGA